MSGHALFIPTGPDKPTGVAFADLNEKLASEACESSKAVASNPNYKAIVVAVDILDSESVKAMVAQTVSAFGRIDYCVNSAGVSILPYHPPVSDSANIGSASGGSSSAL